MPVIPGATGRGLRVLPRLGLGQAVGILVTIVADLVVVRSGLSWGMRLAVAAFTTGAGLTVSVGAWPPGSHGEPAVRWLARLAAYALRGRRLRKGWRDWLGPMEVTGPYLVHRRSCAAVVECAGVDPALGGDEAWAAVAAAYREFLHALGQPLQVVLVSRWLREADRPSCYQPVLAPTGMADVAAAYAAHWGDLVATRRWVVRQVLLVPSAPGWSGGARADIEATVACVQRLATRLGLEWRRLAGDELVCRWREWTGDPCPGPRPEGQPGWRVRGWSDA